MILSAKKAKNYLADDSNFRSNPQNACYRTNQFSKNSSSRDDTSFGPSTFVEDQPQLHLNRDVFLLVAVANDEKVMPDPFEAFKGFLKSFWNRLFEDPITR